MSICKNCGKEAKLRKENICQECHYKILYDNEVFGKPLKFKAGM